ncbi:MAG: hypothetical protein WBF71_08610 [Microthrixaceae bacterium]
MSYQPLDGDVTSSKLNPGRARPDDWAEADDPDGMAFEDLIWALPRLVDRTSKQLELARLLAAHSPCIGSLVSRSGDQSRTGARNSDSGEPLDVLDVLAEDRHHISHAGPSEQPAQSNQAGKPASSASAARPEVASVDVTPADVAPVEVPVPSEGELAVAGYDSLAASQVVPRLATLTKADLAKIHAYERAHRNRQTIMHRVRQLLDN